MTATAARCDKGAASVLLFVPRRWGADNESQERRWRRQRDGEGGAPPRLFVGWCMPGDPSGSTLVVVLAGATTQANAKRIGIQPCMQLGDDRLGLLGSLEEPAAAFGRASTSKVVSDDSAAYKNGAIVWITFASADGTQSAREGPQVKAIQSGKQSNPCAITMIRYNVPRPEQMRYLSLEPMHLPLVSTDEQQQQTRIQPDDESSVVKQRRQQQDRLERLIRLDPIRFAELNRTYARGTAPGQGFRVAIERINRVAYEMDRLRKQTDVSSASSSSNGKDTVDVLRLVWRAYRIPCSLVRWTLNAHTGSIPSLVNTSAAARQISLRLGQVVAWPSLGHRLRAFRIRDQHPVSSLAPRYTALYNGVWLVANDVIVGQAIGSWLCDHNVRVADVVHAYLRPLCVTYVVAMLRWLDSWPLGVKLNTPLSRFFCDMYVGLTDAWAELAVSPFDARPDVLPTLVYTVGIATRLCGVSMLLCILIDITRLITLHVTTFYLIQRAMYDFFARCIRALFHLFRGKKRNPLRGMRVDAATYELDQLLLGTLFFTLFLFLWPTVAAYYVHLAVLRLGVVGAVTVLQTALALVNHLPLFALMLRIKDPARLPGGVALHYDDDDAEEQGKDNFTVTHARLVSVPLGVDDIFRGHMRHFDGLQRLPRLVLYVITGRRF